MKYKVNWPLDTGKKVHQAGAVIDMKEDDAAPLVECGVLSPATQNAAAPAGSGSDAGSNDGGSVVSNE